MPPLPKIGALIMAPHHKHGVSGPELMELMRQQAMNFGTRIVTDDIAKVDLSRRPFKLSSLEGQAVETQCIIVATGARANYLGLPSEEAYKNRASAPVPSATALCRDFAISRLPSLAAATRRSKKPTYLTKFASKVYLVHRRDELRASKIMAERALSNSKIEPVWNHEMIEVLGDGQQGVSGIRLKSTTNDGYARPRRDGHLSSHRPHAKHKLLSRAKSS